MISPSNHNQELSTLWGLSLQPAYCPKCEVAHLIPGKLEGTLCPACFSKRLEHQPSVIRQEPPELILNFMISPDQVEMGFKDWVKGIWFRPKELDPNLLSRRLNRTFFPLWLVDGKITGTWQAQMGYDYQVASSQETYQNGTWKTRKVNETRIRWEARTGTIERRYQNLSVPALEEHPRLMNGIGKYKLDTATSYSPLQLENASIRVPSLLPESAWPMAKSNFDRFAAKDCQIAAEAQHIEEFIIQSNYEDQNWTQLLLPMYTTAYQDEDGIVHTILINGQNGKLFGMKRASQRQTRIVSLVLLGIALLCFVLGLLFAVGTTIFPILGLFSLIFFTLALLLGISAPFPAIWAWNFNRLQVEK
jgi:hypothetical protein